MTCRFGGYSPASFVGAPVKPITADNFGRWLGERRMSGDGGHDAAGRELRKLRELVRSYLERAGLTVLSTASGAEAITLAAAASPDLVALDLMLPDVLAVAGPRGWSEIRSEQTSTKLVRLF